MHFPIWLLLLVWLSTAFAELRCMNFYGLETERKNFVCSWHKDVGWYLDNLQSSMQINTIRMPFSYQYICGHDLSRMQTMIEECQKRNISIILDYHRTWSTHQGPTPEEGITIQDFESTWIHVLERFASYSNVIGVGIFNEVQRDDPFYVATLNRNTIDAIETHFPGRFHYFAGCADWGTDCSMAGDLLRDTKTWNRTLIDVHKYSFNSDLPESEWDRLMPNSTTPDQWFVGEIGWKMSSPKEIAWATKFLTYLEKRNISNVCLWTIAHSNDTEGWWKDDCEHFDYEKAKMLNDTIWKAPQNTSTPPISTVAPTPVPCDCKCPPVKPSWWGLP